MTVMRSKFGVGICSLLVAGGIVLSGAPAGLAQSESEILATYTLPEITLADAQAMALPEYPISDDHGLLLGGVGSDLWHDPSAPADEFWMVTDRGPNGQIKVEEKNRRTFPAVEFTPHILHVTVADGVIEIVDAIGIVGQSGAPVTGLSNIDGVDEKPYDYTAQGELAYNPSGLDTEGLVRAADGTFWLVDEYSPSLIHVGADGVVIKRYVPEGLGLTGADYEVSEALPAIFAERKGNRGFEGLAMSPDGTTLYITLQSPLSNPDGDTGSNSRNTRILVFDVASEQPVAEYVYEFDVATDFDPDPEVIADAMKLSGVVALDATRLLVLERTDAVAKLYVVDMSAATNILGTAWDDVATTPGLEATTDLAAAEVAPLPKELLVDLSTLEGMPGKIEGVAVLNATTIAVANDNDFDIGEFDANGMNVGDGKTSQILIIQTPPIPGLAGEMATPVAVASPVA